MDKEKMQDQTYKMGDTVRQVLGGPLMVVEEVEADGSCLCVWLERNRPNREWFSSDDLVKIDG